MKIRRALNVVALAGIVGAIAYFAYTFATAPSRVKALCAEIRPGMTLPQLDAFARRNGLGPAPRNAPVIFLVETRTFGRAGCKITMEAGAVQSSLYNHAD